MRVVEDLSRRRFVRLIALLGAASVGAGKAWSSTVIADVRPKSVNADGGLLRLRLTDFPALQHDFGSVRLGTSAIGSNQHPLGLYYPVIINRAANQQFYAMQAACTHEGCTVPIYDPIAQLMECPCHGSQYLIDGTVHRGPANFPLQPYAVHFDGTDGLSIELPDVIFSLNVFGVQHGMGRVRLEFIAFGQIAYEVRYRPNLATEWSGPVSFALTPDGPANQTVVALTDADMAAIYIEPATTTGFYAVIMRVTPV
jgi:Rieske Fe-S protein